MSNFSPRVRCHFLPTTTSERPFAIGSTSTTITQQYPWLPFADQLITVHCSKGPRHSVPIFVRTNRDQGSISPTFYAQLLRQQSCASKVQTLSVSIKKLHAQLTYVKAERRTLVKLTPRVNLSNGIFCSSQFMPILLVHSIKQALK